MVGFAGDCSNWCRQLQLQRLFYLNLQATILLLPRYSSVLVCSKDVAVSVACNVKGMRSHAVSLAVHTAMRLLSRYSYKVTSTGVSGRKTVPRNQRMSCANLPSKAL
jgi:hypothetical protein